MSVLSVQMPPASIASIGMRLRGSRITPAMSMASRGSAVRRMCPEACARTQDRAKCGSKTARMWSAGFFPTSMPAPTIRITAHCTRNERTI